MLCEDIGAGSEALECSAEEACGGQQCVCEFSHMGRAQFLMDTVYIDIWRVLL